MRLLREPHRVRVRVNAVHDDAEVRRVLVRHAENADHARVAVVEGRHRVEQVGDQRRSRVHGVDRVVDVRCRVSHRNDDAVVVQVLDGLQRALQLRRDRQQLDVLDASIAALHRLLHLRRRLDVLLRVRAGAVL